MIRLPSVIFSSALLCAFATAGLADNVEVDLSGIANGSWCNVGGGSLFGCSAMPTGQQVFNGEAFNIANGASGNAWFSNAAANTGSGTVSVTIQVNVANANSVQTLMNTLWGQSGASYDSISFTGSMGTITDNLTGDNSLRDYNNYVWTNSIVQPTTVAWTDGSQRLDEQTFSLGAYAGETLTSITLTDSGNGDFSRAFLAALTIDPSDPALAPEPNTMALIGAGLLSAGLFFRRKKA